MESKWSHLKDKACQLRRSGVSIRTVEERLGISRSTLSYWFKDIKLSSKKLKKLRSDWENALVKARSKAILWHNQQKTNRLKISEIEAERVLKEIDFTDPKLLELALGLIYFAEGFKKNSDTGMGNSDPLILKFFVCILRRCYGVKLEKLTCYLHLRADQNIKVLKNYWSSELGIPLENFRAVSIDKRTKGKITYDHYKGVCIVRCGNVAIQRKLVYLSRKFCEKVVNDLRA